MSYWSELRLPTECELLVGFYDLTGYMGYAERTEPRQLLNTMTGYFALTGSILRDAGGHLVKTMGDAGLAVFRRLAPDTRKRFKKHTPPVTYIDVADLRPRANAA